MFFSLFNWLLKKVPYAVALAIPNILWALMCTLFGLAFIFIRADFDATGTGKIFLYNTSLSASLLGLLVCLEFGILRLLEIKKWERKDTKIVNNNI